jgi:hypothetical protein
MKRNLVIGLGLLALCIGVSLLWTSRHSVAVGSITLPRPESVLPPGMDLTKLPALFAPKKAKNRNRVDLLAQDRSNSTQALSDRHNIDTARALLVASPNSYDKIEELVRMKAVDFLSNAVAWKENPEHEYVMSSVKDIILNDNFRRPDDIQERKSLAGSKVYLFATLLRATPDTAEALLHQVEGTPTEPILNFSKGLYLAYGIK